MSSRINNPKYLVSYWPLNNHAQDVVRGNNGTWTGTEAYATGPFNGHSVANHNNAGWIGCGAPANLNFYGKMTVSCWFTAPTVGAGAERLVNHASGADPRWFSYLTLTTGIYVGAIAHTAGTVSVTSTVRLDDDLVHHALFRYDDTDRYLILYVDGEYNAISVALTIPAFTPTGNFEIGSYNGGVNTFSGKIWNVRYYNIALTGDEVKELYDLERRI